MPSPQHTLKLLQEFSIPLIGGVLGALIWANVDPHGYHHFIHFSPLGEDSHLNFHFVMNDLFMALFFGIAAKEITEAALPGGALNPPKKAINPLMGTLGGVFGPVAVYLLYVAISGQSDIANGWGIPTATDIALAWLVARLCFGASHPAVSFLLLLAVADDAIGLGIIAIFYPDPHNPVAPVWLALVVVACLLAYALRKKNVQNYWAYLLGPGVLSWAGLFFAHLHPSLALVAVVPFMPASAHDEGLFAETADDHHAHSDTLNRFEHDFKVFVDFGLAGFGLANAGVELSSIGHATWAVLAGLILGKSVGIFLFSMVADRAGFKLPEGMNGKSLAVAGLIAGLGLTVALFVAGVAFTDAVLQGSAKMGALFSVAVVPLALISAKLLKVKELAPASGDASASRPDIPDHRSSPAE
ncbi:MAG: Na+/H+ antiporter NhaA [Myxococcota bacterium]